MTRNRSGGAGPWLTLRRLGVRRLAGGAFSRLRVADGFSHARSLAFMGALLAVQGVIAVVGLASALGGRGVTDAVRRTVAAIAPGPVGASLAAVIDQARATGTEGNVLALGLGLAGSAVTATTAMGQLQRSLNRIYGLETDRPTKAKYGLAFILAGTAGLCIGGAFVAIAFGGVIGESMADNALTPLWGGARVPLAAVLMAVAVGLLFRFCPQRRQPGARWLAAGAAVAVVAWLALTGLLAVMFSLTQSFGQTYGPLAGSVALLLWCLLSSVGLLFGAAVAAQLEAVRAGSSEPQDATRVRPPRGVRRGQGQAPASGSGTT